MIFAAFAWSRVQERRGQPVRGREPLDYIIAPINGRPVLPRKKA